MIIFICKFYIVSEVNPLLFPSFIWLDELETAVETSERKMQYKGIRHTRNEIIVTLGYKKNACHHSVQKLLSSDLLSKI